MHGHCRYNTKRIDVGIHGSYCVNKVALTILVYKLVMWRIIQCLKMQIADSNIDMISKMFPFMGNSKCINSQLMSSNRLIISMFENPGNYQAVQQTKGIIGFFYYYKKITKHSLLNNTRRTLIGFTAKYCQSKNTKHFQFTNDCDLEIQHLF